MFRVVIRSISVLRHSEAAHGGLLLLAAALSLAVVNSQFHAAYQQALALAVELRVGQLGLEKPLLLWINEGLMAVFFLLIGLELRRELREGALSQVRSAMLPLIAAVGGIAAPALCYVLVASGDDLRGWAIPCATDIAFALGILSLLGSRVPVGLKVFLTAMAVLDDLAAVVIIALFYTEQVRVPALAAAAVVAALLAALNVLGVRRLAPYLLLGAALWLCVQQSGVHATVAGMLIAMAIPANGRQGEPLAQRLERRIEPWVPLLIMPLFAFANAGVPLGDTGIDDLAEPRTLGTILGLLVGKPVGVLLACWAALRLGLATLPDGMNRRNLLGVAILGGVGFTMSLFIGGLAFPSAEAMNSVRLGVLLSSAVAGGVGYLVLRAPFRRRAPEEDDQSVRGIGSLERRLYLPRLRGHSAAPDGGPPPSRHSGGITMDRFISSRALRRLARTTPADAPVVSVYADLRGRNPLGRLDRRIQRLRAPLGLEQRKLVDRSLRRIHIYLRSSIQPGTRGVVVFAREGRSPLFEAFALKLPVAETIDVADGPCLFPIVEIQARCGEFLVIISRNEPRSTRILHVNLGTVVQDVLTKPSESRPNRELPRPRLLARRRWRRRAVDEDLSLLRRLTSDFDASTPLVLVGGSTRIHYLHHRLPEILKSNLIMMDEHPDAALSDLLEKAVESVGRWRHDRALSDARALRLVLRRGGEATFGFEAVMQALADRSAERLLLQRDHPAREDLVKLAVRGGCAIELVDSGLEDLGGVGCRLHHQPVEY